MTDTIQVLILSGGVLRDVSSRVKYAIWTQRPATNGIGTFQVVLDNAYSGLSGLFHGDDPIAISMNSVELFTGYLDKGPMKLQGVNSNYIYLSGRDSGQDTQNKLLWSLYAHTDIFSGKADDIIDDMLSKTSSEIAYASPGTAPEIYYSANWIALADQFKEVLETVNYIGFTDKDLTFQMWPISTGRDSGITLRSLANDVPNSNIIGDIEYEPGDTTDVTNYLIVEGPKTNKDAYTENTSTFWATVYGGTVLSNYAGTSPEPHAGAAAVKVTSFDGLNTGLKLTFPKFWLPYLDFHLIASDDLKISILAHFGGATAGTSWPTLYLTDDSGNKISWGGTDATLAHSMDNWGTTNNVKIGYNENSNANWHTVAGDKLNFTWKVTEIEVDFFYSYTPPPSPDPWVHLEYIMIDDLCFPCPIIACSDQTSGSCVHTLREAKVSRTDITAQVELQQYADQLAPKLAAAMSYLNLTVKGSAGLIGGVWKWLPGYYATANIKDRNGNYLMVLNSKWRFMELTHTYNPDQPKEGHIYYVAIKTVPYNAVIDNKRWTYSNDNPDDPTSKIRMVRDRLRYIENTASQNIEPTPP